MSTKNKDESKENDMLLVESGKFFIDLAKLTFGGLFLTSILELHYDLVLVLIYGFATIVSLTILGFVLIKIGNSKNKRYELGEFFADCTNSHNSEWNITYYMGKT